jgi:hypothetical protein
MSDQPPKLHIPGDFKTEAQAEKDRLAAEETERASAAEPKLHVDSDWKAQAQAEKERLAREVDEKTKARGDRGARSMPEASFRTLVGLLASQAVMGLGTMADPQGGGVLIDMEGARFSIDLLGVLEEKTKGNLTDEESTELTEVLRDIRSRFVQIGQLLAQQAASGAVNPAGGMPPEGLTPEG